MKLKHVLRTGQLARKFSIMALALGASAWAGAQTVSQPTSTLPQAQLLTLPGSPFGIAASADSHQLFVGLSGAVNGIAIVSHRGGNLQLVSVVATSGPAFGVALSQDGCYLAAVVRDVDRTHATSALLIFDAQTLAGGKSPVPLASVALPQGSGPIEVAWTPKGDLLAVAEENVGKIAIVDARKALAGADALVSTIAVGSAPVGLAISNDGRLLYATSEIASSSLPGNGKQACTAAGATGTVAQLTPQGSLSLIDLHLAQSSPKTAVQAQLLAGCQPVRVVLSEQNGVAWVAARGDNIVQAWRIADLASKGQQALISTTPVGTAPVGLVLFDKGRHLGVSNSNRFTAGQLGSLSVVSVPAALAGKGAGAVLQSFSAGEFPREVIASPDGQSIYLGEYSSNVLTRISVANLLASSRP